ALSCLPVGLVLGYWLLTDRRWTLAAKITRFVLPFGAVLLGGGILMGIYNRAVTGDWRQLPYSLNHRQYFRSGPFIFSSKETPEREPHERILRYYAAQHDVPKSGMRLLAAVVRNSSERVLRPFASTLLERWPKKIESWHVGLLLLVLALC